MTTVNRCGAFFAAVQNREYRECGQQITMVVKKRKEEYNFHAVCAVIFERMTQVYTEREKKWMN